MQVALEHVEAAAHGVDVGILEARHEHPAGEVDHIGARSGEPPDVVRPCRRDDPCRPCTATACAQLRAASTV